MATYRSREGARGTRWQAIVEKGGVYRANTFRLKSDAVAWARGIEDKIERGEAVPGAEAMQRTLRDLVKRYKGVQSQQEPSGAKAARRSKRFADLSDAEQGKRSMQLDRWISELGNPKLADLTSDTISEAADRIAGKGKGDKPVSGATVNRYLAALKRVCTAGVRLGWLGSNPVKSVDYNAETRGRVRFLNDAEREALLAACSDDPRLYALVVTAIYSGARQGELLALRWRDYDAERGLAYVQESKNADRRAIPMPRPAADALAELRKVRRLDDDRIFLDADGQATFPRRAWQDALEAAEVADFRFHDLRHTAASYLAMSGATLAEIAEILGHKTLAMVQRYSHLTAEHVSGVADRMAAKFS